MSYKLAIRAVDAHASGAPGRVVLGGVGILDVPGDTMLAKKQYLEQHRDWLRTFMLKEPRGMPSSCLDLVLPPTDPAADVGVVIMEQAAYYPPMSGSNTMCIATVLLETGVVPMQEPETRLTIETPAGLVAVRARCERGRVLGVTFANVPAFATHLDAKIEVDGIGALTVDVAYGGMFYLLVEAAAVGLALEASEAGDLMRLGEQVKHAAREQLDVVHPANPSIDHLESTLWWGPPKDPANHGRNAVVVSTGTVDPDHPSSWNAYVDRCPCGTGTSARLAVLHARGEIAPGEEYRHEGILDSVFTGRIVDIVEVGGHPAVVPEITGRAWITGFAEYVLADDDPYPTGFTLADIWPPTSA